MALCSVGAPERRRDKSEKCLHIVSPGFRGLGNLEGGERVARKRMIDPEFWSDEEIGGWKYEARLFYIGLWNFADDDGRLKAHPHLLKSQIFPYDVSIDIASLQIIVAGKVMWYEINGQQYGWIKNFATYQKINHPTKSKLPPFKEEYLITPGGLPEDSGNTPVGLPPNVIQCNIIKDNIIPKGDSDESLPPKEPISVSEDDAALYTSIKVRFEKEQPQHRFTNYKKEGQSIKWLIEKARARDPDSPDVFLEGMIRMFEYLRSIDKFFKGQPFLPSALNASAIWDRVLSAAQERFKEEQAAIKYDDILEVQF